MYILQVYNQKLGNSKTDKLFDIYFLNANIYKDL